MMLKHSLVQLQVVDWLPTCNYSSVELHVIIVVSSSRSRQLRWITILVFRVNHTSWVMTDGIPETQIDCKVW